MDLKDITIDSTKECEGVRIEEEGTTFIIARANNPEYNKELERLYSEIPKSKREKINAKKADEILCKVMSRTIIKGWENLKYGGKKVEYTPERCYEMLRKPALTEWKEKMFAYAQEEDRYRAEDITEDLGKLLGISDGTKNTEST